MPVRTLTTHPGFENAFLLGRRFPFFADMPSLAEALESIEPSPSANELTSRQRDMLLDVKETEDAIEVRADIPGIPKEDINVEIDKNVLTLTVNHEEKTEESHGGGSKKEEGSDNTTWHHTERSRLFVKRSIPLPESADTSNADASYTDGVLTIKFSKKALLPSATKLTIK